MKNLLKVLAVLLLLLAPGTLGYIFHESSLGPIVFLLTFTASISCLLYLKKRYSLKIDSRIRDEHAW
jgi:hypothetical protein